MSFTRLECFSRMNDRISCLEFYCRISPVSQRGYAAGIANSNAVFSVEEDHRKRMYVQVLDKNNQCGIRNLQNAQWRCTFGIPGESSTMSLFDTMGRCVLDHTMDGFNSLVLAMGPSDSGKTHSIVGHEVYYRNTMLKQLFKCDFKRTLIPHSNLTILSILDCTIISLSKADGATLGQSLRSMNSLGRGESGLILLFLEEIFRTKKPR